MASLGVGGGIYPAGGSGTTAGPSAAEVDVDVCVGNTVQLDTEVYGLWLAGYAVEEAARVLQDSGVLHEQMGATIDLVVALVANHYHFFYLVEKLLHHPNRLRNQLTFQIADQDVEELVEKYYEFDPAVMREILGKKLSSRLRKDLDDVSDKTRVRLRSCRRQFDNIKRVYKAVEDLNGPLVQNISSLFSLSNELASKYAAIVFIANNRFETGKKRLAYLTFDDFATCALRIMDTWACKATTTAAGGPGTKEDVDLDLDRDFVLELRELKPLADKEAAEEHRALACRRLRPLLTDPGVYASVESNFRTLSKAIVTIAYNLNHAKDAKDLFVDVVETLVEPCASARWSAADMRNFLREYAASGRCLEVLRRHCAPSASGSGGVGGVTPVWDRFMDTLTVIVLQLYHP